MVKNVQSLNQLSAGDPQQAALAVDKAETNMKPMPKEVHNKAVNAYKEILRTQI